MLPFRITDERGPAITLRLRPHFDADGAGSHLSATYTLERPGARAGEPFLLYEIFRGNVPAHAYTEADVRAADDAGPLPLEFAPVPGKERREQRWLARQDTRGDVVINVDVFPRVVDETTPLGSRNDLRTDRGGLQGGGRWFLPRLNMEDDVANYTSSVEWDLSGAPPGTRAVSSLGEGPDRVSANGPADTLTSCIFMVGPINSYPPEPRPGNEAGFCGTYWFGDLPENLDRLKGFNTAMHAPMAKLFGMSDLSYRVFIRHVASGFGGSGARDSYVMEYCDSTEKEQDNEIQMLWAHEMVHSFALMDFEDDGVFNAWYSEGLADFYGTFLPYRFGVLPGSYTALNVNGKLAGYYTNPLRNVTEPEAYSSFFNSWYAEKVSYHRGFAFLLMLDSRLRQAAGITDPKAPSPLDDIITDLGRRRRREGQKIFQKDLVAHLKKALGDAEDWQKEIHDMVAGKTIELAGHIVGSPDNVLTETKYGMFEMGVDRDIGSARVVKEVVPGSRAEKAGVKVGDPVLRMSRAVLNQENPDHTYYISTERDGERMCIEWWPRSEREVPCWEQKTFNGEPAPEFNVR